MGFFRLAADIDRMDRIEEISAEEMAFSGRVARVVEIDSVSLVDGAFSLRCLPEEATLKSLALRVGRTVSYEFDQVSGDLRVRITFVLSGGAENEETSLPLLNVKSTFLLRYHLKVEAPPAEMRETLFGSFSKVNGTYNAWPYFREYAQSMSARMNIPFITLPVYQVRSQPQKPSTGTTEIAAPSPKPARIAKKK